MLRECLGDSFKVPEMELSETQMEAFEAFNKGRSILVIGKAGTGKSELIKYIYKRTKDTKSIFVTATTGISAYNIGGVTINSLLGIGTGDFPVQTLVRRVRSKKVLLQRIKDIDILVIDEISMMSAGLFEKIDAMLRIIRGTDMFFGGIQVILSGDFLQLPPVFSEGADTRLLVESELFNRMFKDCLFVLTTAFRQRFDQVYSEILSRIRLGEHTHEDIQTLLTRRQMPLEEGVPVLVSSNRKASAINTVNLDAIPERDYIFEAEFKCTGDPDLAKVLLKDIRFQMEQKGTIRLRLRRGCRVLLIKNLDVSNGLVNGSVGTVLEIYAQSIRVRFDNGYTDNIPRAEFDLEMGSAKVTCKQLPFTLAYSITIHKSQSLSMDCAILDLEDCFCDAQVYVAMSRIKTLKGVYLKSFDPQKITVNKKLLSWCKSK